MSNRIFQSVIAQMKDATDRTVGVVDIDGIVAAASDLPLIGSNLGNLAGMPSYADSAVIKHKGKTFKMLEHGSIRDYAVFAEGEDETARTVCMMAAIAINEAGIYYEENHDKRSFIKKIITDNILPGDIFFSEKELKFTPDAVRGVMVIRLESHAVLPSFDLLQDMFPDRHNDFIVTVGETDIVLVKEMSAYAGTEALVQLAQLIHDKIKEQLSHAPVIGVGMPVYQLRELAEKYKQALIAIDIGEVFEIGKPVVSYENLGISRLIYQLPTTLCRMFLSEVLKRNPIEVLDSETLYTIDVFFENSLNVSETSRKLFIHRNTLVYRLDKILKLTGLDLREFDQAIVFKVALMVNKYLKKTGMTGK